MNRICISLAALAFGGGIMAEPFHPVFIQEGGELAPETFNGLAVFRDAIPSFPFRVDLEKPRLTPFAKSYDYPEKYVRRIPDSQRRKIPYRFEECFERPKATILSDYVKSGKPFFIYERISRPPYFLPADGCPLADRASYAEWKKSAKGFLGFNSIWEFDSDSNYFERFYDRMEDPSIAAELHAVFEPPDTTGRVHRVRWAKKIFPIAADFHFGETRVNPLCSNTMGYEHIFGAMGAAMLWYEATTQSPGAWNAASACVRGAARQRGLDFGWYMAQYYTGYNRAGQVLKGDSRWRAGKSPKMLHRGESRSMHRRQAFYGWLIGAKYLQTEGWQQFYFDERDGKIVPSENARDYNEIYELALSTDRGEPVTPLAVLTPLAEPSATGYLAGNAKLLDPRSQTEIFDTLVPMRGDSGEKPADRRKGEQGCLYNSEFAGFFDVLCPDSGQDSSAFAKALSRYRYVLLAGEAFDRTKFDAAALTFFEQAGGKVLRYPSPELDTHRKLRERLLEIQRETLPVSVEGDIQWGVNRTRKGYLVYLINNKGVVKFCDEPEDFVIERTAHVVVTSKATGEKLVADVKPGDFRLLEVRSE